MTAMDLLAWTKLHGFADEPDLATCEKATFRYRVVHVAARGAIVLTNAGEHNAVVRDWLPHHSDLVTGT